jgi:hypothetical protein
MEKLGKDVLTIICSYLYIEDYINLARAMHLGSAKYTIRDYFKLSTMCDRTEVVEELGGYTLIFWIGKNSIRWHTADCIRYLARASELPDTLQFYELPTEIVPYVTDSFLDKYAQNFGAAALISHRRFRGLNYAENVELAANLDSYEFFSYFRRQIGAADIKKIMKIDSYLGNFAEVLSRNF